MVTGCVLYQLMEIFEDKLLAEMTKTCGYLMAGIYIILAPV
jgi:hypothetical protein